MQKKLTISIAAYNVEKFLPKLLDTIITADKMKDIEVLIINDGSKDSTTEIAEEYHEKYPEDIFLVDKKNGGHGSTINKGIEVASGKYFKVIDGDDWVDSEGLARLVENLEKEDSDMIITDYLEIYENSGEIVEKKYPMFKPYEKYDFGEICNKVGRLVFHAVYFKTEILKQNNIKIDENCYYVDSEYVIFPIPYVETLMYYPINVYCYRLGDIGQSMSFESLQRNIEMHKKVSMRLLHFLNSQPDLNDNVIAFLKSSIIMVNNRTLEILMSFKCKKTYKQDIKRLYKEMKEVIPDARNYIPTKTMRVMLKNIDLYYLPAWIWLKIKANKKRRATNK